MLEELRISNFKGFKGEHSVQLKPITLIYGANSAGKTALIEALLLLKQSLSNSNNGDGTSFAPVEFVGEYVDLASFSSAICGHSIEKEMSFGLTYSENNSTEPEEKYYFDSKLSWDKKRQTTVLDSCTYRVQSAPENTAVFEKIVSSNGELQLKLVRDSGLTNLARMLSKPISGALKQVNENENFDFDAKAVEMLETSRYAIKGFLPGPPEFPVDLDNDFKANTFSTSSEAQRDDEGTTRSIRSVITRDLLNAFLEGEWNRRIQSRWDDINAQLLSIRYIGPLRKSPTRFEQLKSPSDNYVGLFGEHVASILFRNEGVLNEVNMSLQLLCIPYSLTVHLLQPDPFKALGEIVVIQLQDSRTGVSVSMDDVGFGISQILPLIVQIAISSFDLIILEQPELHLHPALQANFSDLIVDSMNSESGNQFLIETHSEHLLLRLQRKIRSGELDSSLIRVIYVDAVEEYGSFVKSIDLDEFGEFTSPWPYGFFPERIDELLG